MRKTQNSSRCNQVNQSQQPVRLKNTDMRTEKARKRSNNKSCLFLQRIPNVRCCMGMQYHILSIQQSFGRGTIITPISQRRLPISNMEKTINISDGFSPQTTKSKYSHFPCRHSSRASVAKGREISAQFYDNLVNLININKTPANTLSEAIHTTASFPAPKRTKIVDFSGNYRNALTEGRRFPLEGKTRQLPF